MRDNGNGNGDGNLDSVFNIYVINGRPIKVINCQQLRPKIFRIIYDISKYLNCCHQYDWVLKQCAFCLGFYIDMRDNRSLYEFKKRNACEKDLLLRTLRPLNKTYPPIPQYVWNSFGLRELSAGFCRACMAGSKLGDAARNQQIKEGNFDCFGRGINFCSQKDCSYFKICVIPEEEYFLWLRRVKFLKEMDQYDFKIIYRH